jgi:hypothetical protein
LNVNYFCRPVASRENVTMEGDIASRKLLLSSAFLRTWWLAVAAPESCYSRQAGGTVIGDRDSLSQA